jgi:hypothetical protein
MKSAVASVLGVSILTAGSPSAQDTLAVALDRIYREYSSQQARPEVGRLVLLDQELRDLIPYYDWQGRPTAKASSSRPEYEDMGVSPAMFEPEFLTYSGKLLLEAHAIDPNSAFRSHTLYSTVFGPEGEVSSGVPSPEAAEAYVREFPAGPFSVHAYLALAHFYDDLYKVIRREEAGRRIDYKYDCYKAYLTQDDLSQQARIAQELGIRYYEQLLRRLPRNEDEARRLANLRTGKEGAWFYCSD